MFFHWFLSWSLRLLRLRSPKVNESTTFKAGILIIGSLLWDKDRQEWREARLAISDSKLVLAPIRYGRRSGKRRGHTYTMVFSRSAPTGHARVVRCANAIISAGDLITEALKLWEAEALSVNSGRLAASWGCVALICNPNRRIPPELLKAWADRVGQEPDYGKVSQAADEGLLISEDGILQINWPHCVEGGAAVDFDLLLVTANDPTLTGAPLVYPSVETIAGAWNNACREFVEYFWNNIDNGICTFEDEEIRVLLKPRSQSSIPL
jgi:hypothetical protein